MMRPAILTIVSLATLSACAAAAAPPRAEFLAAVLLADRPAAQAIEAATAAAPLRKAVAPGGKSSRRQRARLGASPLARVEAANGAAVREPAAAGYVGADHRRVEIHGIAAHDLYHTGQIQLIKRLRPAGEGSGSGKSPRRSRQ